MTTTLESKNKESKSFARIGVGFLAEQFIKFLPLIIIVLLFSIIDSVTYTYLPIFIQYIISTLTEDGADINLPQFILDIFNSGKDPYMRVMYAGIGIAVYQILRGAIKVLSSLFRNILGETLVHRMRYNLYKHIQNLPYSYHTSSDKGELIQRCTNDIDIVRNSVCNQLPEIFSIFSIIISSVYQMTHINSKLTFVSLIIIPVAFISSFIYCRHVAKAFEIIEAKESELISLIQNNVDNVRVVKACNNEVYEIEKFNVKNLAYAKDNYKLNKVSAFYWGFCDFSTLAQYLITCVVAINLVKNNQATLSIGSFAAMMSLVATYIWPVRSLGRIIGDTGKSSVSAGRIKAILNEKDEYVLDNGCKTPIIDGKISFNNVSFKFDDTNEHLLKNLTFDILPGETVAIMGKTGSGKSTIAKLLTRLLEVNDGEILINDVNINEIEKHYIRQNIGLVLQEPFLYTKTVYENISITKKEALENRVKEVSKISAIHNDIEGFDKGYETLVGEKGVTLSGGQKQRVAIARMLLEEKPVLIFDDSLSALDTETDLMIREALKENNQNTTTIIITHRISTARSANKIIVLDNGTISDIGTHDELITKDGFYKRLWDIQGSVEEEFLKLVESEVE